MAALTARLRLSTDTGYRVPRLADALRTLPHKMALALFDPYRPERHYMRGPGPRWYAKHGQALPTIGRDA